MKLRKRLLGCLCGAALVATMMPAAASADEEIPASAHTPTSSEELVENVTETFDAGDIARAARSKDAQKIKAFVRASLSGKKPASPPGLEKAAGRALEAIRRTQAAGIPVDLDDATFGVLADGVSFYSTTPGLISEVNRNLKIYRNDEDLYKAVDTIEFSSGEEADDAIPATAGSGFGLKIVWVGADGEVTSSNGSLRAQSYKYIDTDDDDDHNRYYAYRREADAYPTKSWSWINPRRVNYVRTKLDVYRWKKVMQWAPKDGAKYSNSCQSAKLGVSLGAATLTGDYEMCGKISVSRYYSNSLLYFKYNRSWLITGWNLNIYLTTLHSVQASNTSTPYWKDWTKAEFESYYGSKSTVTEYY